MKSQYRIIMKDGWYYQQKRNRIFGWSFMYDWCNNRFRFKTRDAAIADFNVIDVRDAEEMVVWEGSKS